MQDPKRFRSKTRIHERAVRHTPSDPLPVAGLLEDAIPASPTLDPGKVPSVAGATCVASLYAPDRDVFDVASRLRNKTALAGSSTVVGTWLSMSSARERRSPLLSVENHLFSVLYEDGIVEPRRKRPGRVAGFLVKRKVAG